MQIKTLCPFLQNNIPRIVALIRNLILLCLVFLSSVSEISGKESFENPQIPQTPASVPTTFPVVTDLKITSEGEALHITVELNRALPFSVHLLEHPKRVVVDLPEVVFLLPPPSFGTEKERGVLTDIRYGNFKEGQARIVLDVGAEIGIQKARMNPSGPRSLAQLVLILSPNAPPFEDALSDPPPLDSDPVSDSLESDDSPRLPPAFFSPSAPDVLYPIILDPGHGGVDAGATGRGGMAEKDIALNFAKILREILEDRGFRVLLTREKDQFIPLRTRVEFAKRQDAALFLSIHADSVKEDFVQGLSVYTLSERASDALTRRLAERENRSDLLAGMTSVRPPHAVEDILIELIRRETEGFSFLLAQELLSTLKTTGNLLTNPHRSANFEVLHAYNVPSVLLELGFLSNAEDEKQLTSETYLEEIARCTAEAMQAFLQKKGGKSLAVEE